MHKLHFKNVSFHFLGGGGQMINIQMVVRDSMKREDSPNLMTREKE